MSEATIPKIPLTSQGRALITRSVADEQLNFTRMAMGDGQSTNVSGAVLAHEQVSVPITKKTRSNNILTLFGPVALESSNAPFRWRELGVFGHIGDEPEVLIGYMYLGENGEVVSPNDGTERSIYISLEVSDDANVNVVLGAKDATRVDRVTISIPTEGWKPVEGKYRYQLDLPCSEARVDNTPAVNLDEDSEEIAALAGLSPSADTFDGILRLKAMEIPSAPMTATVTLIYIGNGSGPDGGGGTYVLPVAGTDTLGGIKVGDGLSVAPDGTLSVNAETVMTDDDLVNEDEAKESVIQILTGD